MRLMDVPESVAPAKPMSADIAYAASANANVIKQIVVEMAARLASPDLVQTSVAAAARQAASDRLRFTRWQDHSLAQGYSGLALVCGYLDRAFPENGWDRIGHDYLRRAVAGLERLPAVGGGLWGGVAGVAMATDVLSRGGQRYARLSAQLDAAILAWAKTTAHGLCRDDCGLPVARFDLISGLVGVGCYLLGRDDCETARHGLRQVLSAVVALAEDEAGLPRWFTPPQYLDAANRARFPRGSLNCGLAHGVPGLLALLALAELNGVAVRNGPAAMRRLADWITLTRQKDEYGPTWPAIVQVGTRKQPSRSRDGWCYGSPGVARALWLAGQAIPDKSMQELSVAAMAAVFARPVAVRNIDSPTFCHGVAGLLGVTLQFARDSSDACFAAATASLSEQLIELYEPSSLLGYRSRERGRVAIDQPGLLDGSPGVLLVLMAAIGGITEDWGRPFLLR
jgi:hypothetical protein